jgi:hypothetical protein
MAEENKSQEKRDYSSYQPLQLNLAVFFNAVRKEEQQTSLSLSYTRNYFIFDFSQRLPDGSTKKITKKFTWNETYLFNEILKMIIKNRLETLSNKSYIYNELIEKDYEIYSGFYDKEKRSLQPSGKMTVRTVTVDNIKRIEISGYNSNGPGISVVLGNENYSFNLKEPIPSLIIDAYDIPLYRFSFELNNALNNSLLYAGLDKIYQAVIFKNTGQKEKQAFNPFNKGFFNKNPGQKQINNGSSNQRATIVSDVTEEEDSDLFDSAE